jgi:hypothetical protein
VCYAFNVTSLYRKIITLSGVGRSAYRGKQITLYANTVDEMATWKRYCQPNTFNSWVRELIQREIEHRKAPALVNNIEEVNRLKRKNLELENEITTLMSKLNRQKGLEADAVARRDYYIIIFKEILDVFKPDECLTTEDVLKRLTKGKDPDRSRVKVNTSLRQLGQIGIIELTSRGWVLRKT